MTSCSDLTSRLAASVRRSGADALLLSGGLDSAILTTVMRPAYCVTAAFGQGAPDLAFARQVAGKYCARHAEEVFGEEEMSDMVETVIQVFKTFDPIEIRNSCVALAGLQRAKADGFARVATGDGSDELFAGYNYLSRHHGDAPCSCAILGRHASSPSSPSKHLRRMNLPHIWPPCSPTFSDAGTLFANSANS